MSFMVLMKYILAGISGGGLLILLAKGLMAPLLQRREDYYGDCCSCGSRDELPCIEGCGGTESRGAEERKDGSGGGGADA